MREEALLSLLVTTVAIILPLLPSFLLFKYLPSSGDISGPFHGMTIKFGGAFAAYLVLVLIVVHYGPKDANHFHTWTVRGSVEANPAQGEEEPNLNDLYVRFVPPRLTILNQGAFEWEIPVIEDANGILQFPSLQLDLAGYRGLTIPLGSSSYGAASPPMERNESQRLIVLKNPIKLTSTKIGRAYAGANLTPLNPQPNTAVAATP